jgi:hypothetical protein
VRQWQWQWVVKVEIVTVLEVLSRAVQSQRCSGKARGVLSSGIPYP